MLIATLQVLAFLLISLLLTIWQNYIADPGKFRSGMWCFLASVGISGLTGAWLGPIDVSYYDLGYALSAIVFVLSLVFTFDSLIHKSRVTGEDETEQR